MLSIRKFFIIKSIIPDLINEDCLFEERNQELSEQVRAIEKFKKAQEYPQCLVKYIEGVFHIYAQSHKINVFYWRKNIIKPRVYSHALALDVLTKMIDNDQWIKITDHAKNNGLRICNPIKPGKKITSRVFFELIASYIVDEFEYRYINKDVFFEHFEKRTEKVMNLINDFIANSDPQDFLTNETTSLRLFALFTRTKIGCHFLFGDGKESEYFSFATKHIFSFFCKIYTEIQKCAFMCVKKTQIVKMINEDLKSTGNNFIIYLEAFNKQIKLPLDENELSELNEDDL